MLKKLTVVSVISLICLTSFGLFKALAESNPQLRAFEPAHAAPGDRITLSGDGFGSSAGDLKVIFSFVSSSSVEDTYFYPDTYFWADSEIRIRLRNGETLSKPGTYSVYLGTGSSVAERKSNILGNLIVEGPQFRRPDLTITGFHYDSGQNTTLATVCNVGGAKDYKFATYDVSYVIDKDDAQAGSGRRVVYRETQPINGCWDHILPAGNDVQGVKGLGLTPGEHKIAIFANSDGEIMETNPSNNELIKFVTVGTPQPQQGAYCKDTDSKAGHTTQGTVNGVDAKGNPFVYTDWCTDPDGHNIYVVEYYCEGNEPKDWSSVNCEEEFGRGASCSRGACVPPVVQPEILQPEIIPLADLVITDIITIPAQPNNKVSTYFEAKVKNQGKAKTGVFNIKWFIDGQGVGYGSHGPLGIGKTQADYSDNVRLDRILESGDHSITYTMDVDNHVSEENESNNSFTKSFKVIELTGSEPEVQYDPYFYYANELKTIEQGPGITPWHQYSNNEEGIRFSYPYTWEVVRQNQETTTREDNKIFLSVTKISEMPEEGIGGYGYTVITKTGALKEREEINRSSENSKCTNGNDDSFSNCIIKKFNNTKGKLIVFKPESSLELASFYFIFYKGTDYRVVIEHDFFKNFKATNLWLEGIWYNDHQKIVEATEGNPGRNYDRLRFKLFLYIVSQLEKYNEIVTPSIGQATTTAPVIFKDVTTDHAQAQAIDYLRKHNIVKGYDDGTFQPNKLVNRAELMKMIVEGIGITPDVTLYRNCFPDVKNEWFAPYICFAKSQDWIGGYANGYFMPNQTINKVEALKIIINALHLNRWLTTQVTTKPYEDVELGEWYLPYVKLAKEKGILDEKGNLLKPNEPMNRGSISGNIFRAIILEKLTGSSLQDVYTNEAEIFFTE
ncbi:hypothetical protein COT40_00695 [Candidatus Peregrinibacteria bacterium CG08_land_8_20_14_0_20_41_10]|nr:MAG: hypothetical protein COT40_00695 [Candidatus Peregrinibacteria bacterium CG08_land_8_20_14_0_20_41_10]